MKNYLLWLTNLIFVLSIIITTAVCSDLGHLKKRSTDGRDKKVTCYFTSWNVWRAGAGRFTLKDIDPNLCTHLIYAFSKFSLSDNTIQPTDQNQHVELGGYEEFNNIKKRNGKLKTMISLGGWRKASAAYSALSSNEKARTQFSQNAVKFLRENDFDGLDICWEYPSDERNGGKPSDKENSILLLKDIRSAFDEESRRTGNTRLILSMVAPSIIDLSNGYDLENINQYIDFLNVVAFDYRTYDYVTHHAPLYSLQKEFNNNIDAAFNLDTTVRHYHRNGMDYEKIVLGIPTYARTYTLFYEQDNELGASAEGPGNKGEYTRESGYLAYYEVCTTIKNTTGWTIVHLNRNTLGPYAYRGNQWVAYDDEDAARLKGKYANENNLGGIMFWSINNDDFRGQCHSRTFPIINAGKDGLMAGEGGQDSNTQSGSTNENDSEYVMSETTTGTPKMKFVCKTLGLAPDPDDCAKYFVCVQIGSTNPNHQTCPPVSGSSTKNDWVKLFNTPVVSKIDPRLTKISTTTQRQVDYYTTTTTTESSKIKFENLDDSHLESFFESMLGYTKLLPAKYRAEVRNKLFEVVRAAEFAAEKEKPNSNSSKPNKNYLSWLPN